MVDDGVPVVLDDASDELDSLELENSSVELDKCSDDDCSDELLIVASVVDEDETLGTFCSTLSFESYDSSFPFLFF